MESPSPQVLLASWVVLAVAITTYYRTRLGHRHRRCYLIGSMLMAFVVGGLEGSGVATIILTGIPWCLTVGVLLHALLHGADRAWRKQRARTKEQHSKAPPSPDVEKTAGEGELF